MKALVIKNLSLGFHEFATSHLDAVGVLLSQYPDCEVVILAGNLATESKRSLLFADEVAKLTTLPILYGLGVLEYATLATMEHVKSAVLYRLRTVKSNVVYADDFVHPEVEFKCVFGSPLLDCTQEEWKVSLPGRRLVNRKGDFYIGDELASNHHPFNYTVDEFNAMFETEKLEWSGKKRILISAIAEKNDPLFTMNYKAPSIDCDVRLDRITESISIVEL